MSYKALYRKYRPLKFTEIKGQEHICKTLTNIIKNEQISHAYLFTGPHGTGKTSIAKIFAKTLNCLQNEDAHSCEKCIQCIDANENKSLDIIEMDAASNNGVSEIRAIRGNINYLPTNSKYKIYIIDEVHMLTEGAFNALLKTLEEPPEHIIFILATTSVAKIPLTILSRVQRFNFHKISHQDISINLKNIFLKENIKFDLESIDTIAWLSNGSMRDALSLGNQIASYTNSNITNNDISKMFGIMSIKKRISLLNALAGIRFGILIKTIK